MGNIMSKVFYHDGRGVPRSYQRLWHGSGKLLLKEMQKQCT